MINYEKTREVVVSGLMDFLQCPVIRQNQAQEPPAYEYLSYTITTLASQNNGTYGEYDDGTQAKPVKQIWSISAFSDDDSKCVELIVKARNWLDNIGTTYLNDNGVIVESVGGITNRDNLLTIGYEYRKGFDVTFMLADVIENTEPETIESFEIGIEQRG